jgi:hypothetical protein
MSDAKHNQPPCPPAPRTLKTITQACVAQHQAEIDQAEALVAAEDAGLPDPGAAAAAALAEATAAVEAARRDPITYAAALRAALELAGAMAAQGQEDAPPGWEWIACDLCENWRLVPTGFYREKGLGDEVPFKCADNVERPGASCEEPNDWPKDEGGDGGGEEEEGGGGGYEEEGGGGEGEEGDVWEEMI